LDPVGDTGLVTVNCTVAYMGQCMSWNKCKASCTSMGATSYRWFHDGCCECVGNQCINYGINQSRCEDCPLLDEEVSDEEMEMLVNMDFDSLTTPADGKTHPKWIVWVSYVNNLLLLNLECHIYWSCNRIF